MLDNIYEVTISFKPSLFLHSPFFCLQNEWHDEIAEKRCQDQSQQIDCDADAGHFFDRDIAIAEDNGIRWRGDREHEGQGG